jgi:hypothetical protein
LALFHPLGLVTREASLHPPNLPEREESVKIGFDLAIRLTASEGRFIHAGFPPNVKIM